MLPPGAPPVRGPHVGWYEEYRRASGRCDCTAETPSTGHAVSGIAEVAGGLGLILPGLTRIRPQLTPLAASGLVVVMLGAAVWHLTRGELANIGGNLVMAALLAFIAWVRWTRHPLPDRADAASQPAA